MSEHSQMERDQARAIPLNQIQNELLALLDQTDETGVADAVDLLISQGAYHGCSDIHLEPESTASCTNAPSSRRSFNPK